MKSFADYCALPGREGERSGKRWKKRMGLNKPGEMSQIFIRTIEKKMSW
jgi:hypothetical protein